MARRKKAASHPSHERWLISYADFITLLFAFFVVMFASSQADKDRAQEMSDAVKNALDHDWLSPRFAAILGGTQDDVGKGNAMMRGAGGSQKSPAEKHELKVAELTPSLKLLNDDLKDEVARGSVVIRMEPRGLVVSFKEAAVFSSGEDLVSPGSYGSLAKLAKVMGDVPNPIRLEGHTDSIPISTARFHSNWELSAARAIAIMDLLSSRYGVSRERMSIAGYADIAPVASNDTEEGRAKNRRVDIVILNEEGLISEPNNPQQSSGKTLN